MASKTCFKCGEEKPLTDYYVHKRMRDGRLGKCKECTKSDVRTGRKENLSYYRLYDKKRYHTSEERKKQCRNNNSQLNKKTYPETKKQISALNNAIRDKRITKSEICELCFHKKDHIHGHHVDYNQSLNVIWLCAQCHKTAHMYENLVKERFGYNNITK